MGHASKKFAYKYCNKAFQLKGALKDHLKVHTGKGMYPCTSCDLEFASNRAMLRHATKHQGKTYSCAKCPKKTSSPYDMRQHVQGAHEGGFPCPCGEKNGQEKCKSTKKCTAYKEILAKRNLKCIKLVAKLGGKKWCTKPYIQLISRLYYLIFLDFKLFMEHFLSIKRKFQV